VHGCCYKERCDYLSLFAVGSLIGKTKEVDMEFTRAHTMVRMKVEVTRVELIPTTTVDHTYDGEGYGLIFKVEDDQGKGKVDAVMHDASLDDESENKKDKVKEAPKGVDTNSTITKPTAAPNPIQPKTNNVPPKQVHASLPMIRVGQIDCHTTPIVMPFRSESRVMDLAPRRLWGDSDNDDEDSLPSPLPRLSLQSVDTETKSPSVLVDSQITVSISENADVGSVAAENVKISAEVGDVTEKQTAYAAAEIPVASLATVFIPEETQLPMTPQNAPNVGQPSHKTHCFDNTNSGIPCIDDKERASPLNNISWTSISILPNSDYVFSSTIEGLGSGQHVFTPVLSQGGDSKFGTGVFLGGRCSVEDVVNFGGIPSPSLNAHSSERIRKQGNADATQLERAKYLAKAKDAALSPGTNQPSRFSLSSLSDDTFLHRANKLGVSLGGNSAQVQMSIHTIKQVDNKRTLIMIQKNIDETNKNNEMDTSEIIQHASLLSTDLRDDAELISKEKSPIRETKPLKVYARKKKVAPKIVRRSERLSKKKPAS
jgi:hypothetical protein